MKHSKNDQKQLIQDTRLDSRQIDYIEWGKKKKRKNSHCFPSRLDKASWVCHYDDDSGPLKKNPDEKEQR